MASISWDSVVDFAPAMSKTTVGARVAILAFVNGNGVNVNAFDGEDGETTKLARVALAAHLGSTFKVGAAGGPITSQSAGGLSRSFGAWSSASALGTTGFGQIFLTLAKAGAGGAALL